MFARKDLNLEWLEIAGQARNDGTRSSCNDGTRSGRNDGTRSGGHAGTPTPGYDCGTVK